MAELHTDDTFMYENCLVGDASGMAEDPLVNRITHQRGPKVSANVQPNTPNFDLRDEQEQALDDLVRDAEELGLYDDTPANELGDPSELVDWTKAPHWATYWAINSKGIGFWFGDYFSTYQGDWSRNRVLGDGSATPAPNFGWPAEKWESSLVARPKESSPSLSTEVSQEELDSLSNRGSKLVKAMGLDKDPMKQQVSGSHYNKYPIQPAEYCYKNGLNNLQSEAISYITRYGDKGGKTDLEKAIHTLEMLIHMEYGE